jgi:hypothetical protein
VFEFWAQTVFQKALHFDPRMSQLSLFTAVNITECPPYLYLCLFDDHFSYSCTLVWTCTIPVTYDIPKCQPAENVFQISLQKYFINSWRHNRILCTVKITRFKYVFCIKKWLDYYNFSLKIIIPCYNKLSLTSCANLRSLLGAVKSRMLLNAMDRLFCLSYLPCKLPVNHKLLLILNQ